MSGSPAHWKNPTSLPVNVPLFQPVGGAWAALAQSWSLVAIALVLLVTLMTSFHQGPLGKMHLVRSNQLNGCDRNSCSNSGWRLSALAGILQVAKAVAFRKTSV
ncbi:hypothetical protein Salat_2928400 [Sesamum alatum]|uniref:Uncharacterized protein n=1 Tax=Sesamum alatum TaxID=300844 RepID=A0AAE1XJX8_9LAMI|nr:hypothetical protein Salat_2928400 [Sesamum alatum]